MVLILAKGVKEDAEKCKIDFIGLFNGSFGFFITSFVILGAIIAYLQVYKSSMLKVREVMFGETMIAFKVPVSRWWFIPFIFVEIGQVVLTSFGSEYIL